MSEPSYFAVIPATVRYHEDLSPNAKLLFGELTALCNREGFCWATNDYFAKLYKVSSSTVSEWVSSLKRAGFVRVEIDQRRGNERKIHMLGGLREMPMTSSGKAEEGSSGKAEPHIENNTKGIREALSLSSPDEEKRRKPKAGTVTGTKPTQDMIETFCQSVGLPRSDGYGMLLKWNADGWPRNWRDKIRQWKHHGWMPSQKSEKPPATQLSSSKPSPRITV